MKIFYKSLALSMLAIVALSVGTPAQAYYDRYPDGYWDHHGHYQHYEVYHHHRGYWDQRNGSRIFIRIG